MISQRYQCIKYRFFNKNSSRKSIIFLDFISFHRFVDVTWIKNTTRCYSSSLTLVQWKLDVSNNIQNINRYFTSAWVKLNFKSGLIHYTTRALEFVCVRDGIFLGTDLSNEAHKSHTKTDTEKLSSSLVELANKFWK